MSSYKSITMRLAILVTLAFGQLAFSKAPATETCQECMNQLNACIAECPTTEPLKAICDSSCVRTFEVCSESCTE